MTLKDLKVGQSAVIDTVGGEGELRQHFLDMGVIPQMEVTLVKLAPLGDPMELQIQGYELTLRLDDAAKIQVHAVEKKSAERPGTKAKAEGPREKPRSGGTLHPGYGEGRGIDSQAHEPAAGDGQTLTFALAGNQNCGKTTLFNQLTGANQHVGNFPGVTVDRKSGPIRGRADTLVTDLPGIYSLSPYSSEEIVSRQFILI